MDTTPKFFKFLTESDLEVNEMRLPGLFCQKIAHLFPSHVKLFFRNGFTLWVGYEKNEGMFTGVLKLYREFGLKKGQTLLFEYVSMFNFKVFVIGIDFTEIEYPIIRPSISYSDTDEVLKHVGGMKFLYFLSCGETIIDQVVVPRSFVSAFGRNIPPTVEYVLNDGTRFLGGFMRDRCMLTGLFRLSKLNLNEVQLLVFTYNGDQSFKINFYDISMTEGLKYSDHNANVADSLRNTVGSSANPNQCYAFEIEIKQFHMLKYAYGVDIPCTFRALTSLWGKDEVIKVEKGKKCWTLEIKRRPDYKRPTIRKGWTEFRDALKLNVGDVCVFRMKNNNIREFTVQVTKAV